MPARDRRALGVILGLALCLSGIAGLRPALARLHAARDRGAFLAAVAGHAPPPPAPIVAGEVLKAPDRERARDALRLLLRDEAIRQGVLIERLAPARGDPAVAAIDLVLSGPPVAVSRFAGTVENHVPTVRLARWRVVRAGAGASVRLDALAVAPWARGG